MEEYPWVALITKRSGSGNAIPRASTMVSCTPHRLAGQCPGSNRRKRVMGKLTGKVAIVTGASRGIGQMISELFASEGAKVVCAARTMNEGEHRMLEGSLARTVANIKAQGGEATACTADVSTEPDCIALVEAARRAYGTVDILVNNAALNYYLPTETYPTNRW